MKIQAPVITNTKIQNQPNFKALGSTIGVQNKIAEVVKTPQSKQLFIKLAGIAGLTSILAWAKSLSSSEDKTKIETQLDVIDKLWINQINKKVSKQDAQKHYLDIVSKMDNTETEVITKALLSENEETMEESDLSLETSKNLFLDEKSHETFMNVSANTKLNTILNQLKMLLNIDETQRENEIEKLEKEFNSMVKAIDKKQEDIDFAKLYEKLANIAKNFTIYNLLPNQRPNIIVTQANNKPKLEKTEEITTEVQETQSSKPEETFTNENVTDNTTTIPENRLKIVRRIEIKDDGINRFRPKTETPQEQVKKEFVITEHNKDFIDLFKKQFKKDSLIEPEVYADQIDFIKSIYEGYEKDNVKKVLLKLLSKENYAKFIDKYKVFSTRENLNLDFIGYLNAERLKHKYSGDISQEDFDKLNNYKNNEIKYFKFDDYDDSIELTFVENIPFIERLKITNDFYRILYNPNESQLYASRNDTVTTKDVEEELIKKLSANYEDYPNIMKYLDINKNLIETEFNNNNTDGVIDTLQLEFADKKVHNAIKALVDILNNPAFDDIIEGTHGKMRFLERFVFDKDSNITKNEYQIKQVTSKEIEKLKTFIEKAKYATIKDYEANHLNRKGCKRAPTVQIGKLEFCLNENNKIHTIYKNL